MNEHLEPRGQYNNLKRNPSCFMKQTNEKQRFSSLPHFLPLPCSSHKVTKYYDVT